MKQHCPESGFAACAYRDRSKVIVGLFLWSLEPGKGAYMIADAEQRRALSTQDKAFAGAVLRTHPIEQGGRILDNGWRQMLRFDIDTLDTKCTRQAALVGHPCRRVSGRSCNHSVSGRARPVARAVAGGSCTT